MKRNTKRMIIAAGVGTLALSTTGITAFAGNFGQMGGNNNFGMQGQMQQGMQGQNGFGMNGTQNSTQNGISGNIAGNIAGNMMGGMMGQTTTVASAESPTDIVESTVSNTAQYLTADESSATTYTMSDSNNEVKIDTAGTYIITGSCSDGNIVVKKGTTGVVLILQDLDLTSTTGATLSCNKNTEVKIIVRGDVTLTDAEDPTDEDSTDADVADAFDGAALKAKDGSNVYLTGTGTLTLDGSSCKNGLKVGDSDTPSFVIDGDLTINIYAANDGINAGYDLTILDGDINVNAGDDGIHADRILTLGDGSDGPSVNIESSTEGLEGTVVNLFGGYGDINASDDGINAANSDETYCSEMDFSINITAGTWTINCSGDGLDSNGNINITGGYTTINSGTTGGEAGIDYVGSFYYVDGCLSNNCGVASDSMMGMGGMTGNMNGNMMGNTTGTTGNTGTTTNSQGSTTQPQMGGQMNGQMGGMNGRMGGFGGMGQRR